MIFGEFIRTHRTAVGLTRAALARRCQVISPDVPGFGPNIGRVTIKFWEDEVSRRMPSAAQLDVLCDALRLSMSDRFMALRLCRERLEAYQRTMSSGSALTASAATYRK